MCHNFTEIFRQKRHNSCVSQINRSEMGFLIGQRRCFLETFDNHFPGYLETKADHELKLICSCKIVMGMDTSAHI